MENYPRVMKNFNHEWWRHLWLKFLLLVINFLLYSLLAVAVVNVIIIYTGLLVVISRCLHLNLLTKIEQHKLGFIPTFINFYILLHYITFHFSYLTRENWYANFYGGKYEKWNVGKCNKIYGNVEIFDVEVLITTWTPILVELTFVTCYWRRQIWHGVIFGQIWYIIFLSYWQCLLAGIKFKYHGHRWCFLFLHSFCSSFWWRFLKINYSHTYQLFKLVILFQTTIGPCSLKEQL